MQNYEALPTFDKLLKKIYAYYQTIWREKWKEGIENDWLENFKNPDDDIEYREKLNMLYLLSKFMYFGNEELRQLLYSLFRDLFKYPIVEKIREENGDTTDLQLIHEKFQYELSQTRFLGVGNPSESGVHMLYYFRQECNLSKQYFINSGDIFSTSEIVENLSDGSSRTYLKSEIKNKDVRRYVFLDDFCGSGSQASQYLKNLVKNIKFEDDKIEVNYLMLFSTLAGHNAVRNLNVFNRVDAVYTIDDSFKAFSDTSRYYNVVPDILIEK